MHTRVSLHLSLFLCHSLFSCFPSASIVVLLFRKLLGVVYYFWDFHNAWMLSMLQAYWSSVYHRQWPKMMHKRKLIESTIGQSNAINNNNNLTIVIEIALRRKCAKIIILEIVRINTHNKEYEMHGERAKVKVKMFVIFYVLRENPNKIRPIMDIQRQ